MLKITVYFFLKKKLCVYLIFAFNTKRNERNFAIKTEKKRKKKKKQ